MRGVQERHPELDLENCGSGGMRMDYQLLEVADLQSMTDQQDFLREAVIAAAGPSLVLPEQCGNWAYPSVAMSEEETAYSLVGGVLGRLYLSGFLGELRAEQRELVHAATALHREWRGAIARSVPSWPLGLPGWEDEVFALALTAADSCLLGVWSRGDGGPVAVPGYDGWRAVQVFPPAAGDAAAAAPVDGTLAVTLPAGPSARIVLLTRPSPEADLPENPASAAE
ncbi:alpha-galactosidase [Naasia aerilata]|uniref:Alpha-galactosidase n=1 Tax=Naasia aerilata TaxID=1162966 RepID=A0ABN6XL97_9MICO|nr:alpha-galactosidase [Naasia aerilata]BDZ45717.1 hypothetical protein GCM10025866_16260 [Naasia aerilata]